jgi:hypothetical protein
MPFFDKTSCKNSFFKLNKSNDFRILTQPKIIQFSLEEKPFLDFNSGFIPIEFNTINLNLDEDTVQFLDKDFFSNCITLFSSFILSPGKLLRMVLEKLLYIGPLRKIPQRNYFRPNSITPQRWGDGLAAWDAILKISNEELQILNSYINSSCSLSLGYTIQRKHMISLDVNNKLYQYLRQAVIDDLDEDSLPLLREFFVQIPETRIYLRNETTGIEVEPHDMGTGISQVLPIVIAAALARPGALVALEQPELHIHPKLQVALGDIFIKTALSKENAPMFLLETHSEHLMLRLLGRVRETTEGELGESIPPIAPEMISVLYVQGKAEGGTEVIQLPITPDGDFEHRWPNGFFAERAEELF